jgi:D-alanyl-D-alanine endopeptidase (penicillin-binding protein 7)
MCCALSAATSTLAAQEQTQNAPAQGQPQKAQRLDLFFDSSYLRPAASELSEPSYAVQAAPTESFHQDAERPQLWASSALVVDPVADQVLMEKNAESVQPIASVTKLMTALVVLNSGEPLDEVIKITQNDVGYVRHTRSRFGVGQRATRADLLRIMLMASDNRAAMALANNHPGGFARFVATMNETARQYGMTRTHFVDPVGMSPSNVSRAYDLVTLVRLAAQQPLIRKFSTTGQLTLATVARRHRAKLTFVRNTNALTRSHEWAIELSKTGYISQAGHCLVMQAKVSDRPVVIVLLDSYGRQGRLTDAQHIKDWLEQRSGVVLARM